MVRNLFRINTISPSFHTYSSLHFTKQLINIILYDLQNKARKYHCFHSVSKLKPEELGEKNHYSSTMVSTHLPESSLLTFARMNYSCKLFYLSIGSYLPLVVQRHDSSNSIPSLALRIFPPFWIIHTSIMQIYAVSILNRNLATAALSAPTSPSTCQLLFYKNYAYLLFSFFFFISF